MASTDKAAMGAFVVGGLLLFGLGLFLIGDRRMMFSKSAEYYTEFGQLSALAAGAKVRVGGMDAGEVIEVRVPRGPGARFRVTFKVVAKLFPVVRADSVASIATDGLLGNKFLLVDIGTTGPAQPGSTLPSREPLEIGDVLAKMQQTFATIDLMVDAVTHDVTNATKSVSGAAAHLDQIMVAAQAPIDRFTVATSRFSEDAGAIMARIRAGEGSLGKLLSSDDLYSSLSGSGKDAQRAMADLREASTDVKDLVSRIKAGDVPADIERTIKNLSESSDRVRALVASFQPDTGGGDGATADLRATVGSAREAMSALAENLQALKHSFFFRGFFKDRGFYDLGSLSPVEYQSKAFEKNVTKQRVWIGHDELFTLTADGSEALSVTGKAKLDSGMADFLRFTIDRAVIVEGYAVAGTSNEQFVRSRERATIVRNYIVKKFTISPDYVGAMPMGAMPGHGDGIALVLLQKK